MQSLKIDALKLFSNSMSRKKRFAAFQLSLEKAKGQIALCWKQMEIAEKCLSESEYEQRFELLGQYEGALRNLEDTTDFLIHKLNKIQWLQEKLDVFEIPENAPKSGSLFPEWVATLARNRWQL